MQENSLIETLPAAVSELLGRVGEQAGRREGFPLSIGQQALWAIAKLSPDSPAYNIATSILLAPDTDVGVLREVLNHIVARHHALRIKVDSSGAGLRQYPDPLAKAPISTISAAEWPDEDIDAYIERETNRPFDLDIEIPVRLAVIDRRSRNAAGTVILLIVLHHIAADFRSFDIILTEIEDFYRGGGQARGFAAARFSDHVWREERWLASADCQAALEFWRGRLAAPAIGALDRAARLPRPSRPRFLGIERRNRLSPEVTAQIRSAARACGVTPYIFMLAAYGLLEGRLTDRRMPVIGTTVDLRDAPNLRAAVGYLVNTMPLPIEIDLGASFGEMAQETARTFSAAIKYRHLPFARLVQQFNLHRDPATTPVFQALFTWLKFESGFGHGLPDRVVVDTVPVGLESRVGITHDIVLTVEDRRDVFDCLFRFNTDFFSSQEASEIAARYADMVGQVSQQYRADLRALFPAKSAAPGPEREIFDL